MSDEFFDDELELMEAAADCADTSVAEAADAEAPAAPAAEAEAALAAEAAAPASATDGAESEPGFEPVSEDAAAPEPSAQPAIRRDAPPFWMVLAIAAIALILGVIIGYMLGTSATLAELGNASAEAPQATGDASAQLPQGHPDLNVNEDGTATVAGSGSAE